MKGSGAARYGTPHVGDQLELALDDQRVRIPWEGRSPRGLTRGFGALFLRQAPPKKRERSRDCPGQIDLFEDRKRLPGRSRGAPLLFEPEG